jgi:hypothetical protein
MTVRETSAQSVFADTEKARFLDAYRCIRHVLLLSNDRRYADLKE